MRLDYRSLEMRIMLRDEWVHPLKLHNKLWWRRWRSGAYDPTVVMRNALLRRMRHGMADNPDYFTDDYKELLANGKFDGTKTAVSRGALDMFWFVKSEYRMPERWVPRCLVALGMHKSGWLGDEWQERCAQYIARIEGE